MKAILSDDDMAFANTVQPASALVPPLTRSPAVLGEIRYLEGKGRLTLHPATAFFFLLAFLLIGALWVEAVVSGLRLIPAFQTRWSFLLFALVAGVLSVAFLLFLSKIHIPLVAIA